MKVRIDKPCNVEKTHKKLLDLGFKVIGVTCYDDKYTIIELDDSETKKVDETLLDTTPTITLRDRIAKLEERIKRIEEKLGLA